MSRLFSRIRHAPFLLIPLIAATPAAAQGPRQVVRSQHSYDETIEGLKSAVGSGGMMIMAEVDQGNIMSMTGLKMQGHLFLVGNPTVGKQVFSQDPGAGLYLPFRIYISVGEGGQVTVSYDQPSVVLGQFHNDEITKTARMLDTKLGQLVNMVAH